MSPGFPESLFEFFARAIDAELHFETETSGPPAGIDPFADGTFDLGWICSTSFVDLALRTNEPSVQLVGVAWVPDDPDSNGRPVYFGDVVVRADSEAAALADLAGQRIGCNDAVSLSGHHALRLAIEEMGQDPLTFADLVFTGGHHNSLDALIDAAVDAAVVDSVVRIGRARHDEAVDGLRVIERLGPWPVQPLVARSDLDPAFVVAVRDALLIASEQPEIAQALHDAALTKLVPVDANHYAPVRDALQRSEH
ncbi:MAG: ABC-type phosphate/phosphonate transport system substrate-binding protein [Candidatus Aldehydirespiratoraceae bacterium]|jgi:ABC-type phosphate/phosphonate transport system substrate-binding protein